MESATQELVELGVRWLRAGLARDVDFLQQHSFSPPNAPLHTIASVPGGSLSLDTFLAHLAESPPRELMSSRPHGYMHGDVAWLFDEATVDMLWDGITDVRFTMVLVRVEGTWRVVQSHLSEGVPRDLNASPGAPVV